MLTQYRNFLGPATPLKFKLESFAPLTPDDLEVLRRCEEDPRVTAINFEMPQAAPRLIVSGWVGRVVMLRDGRVQIIELLIAGDVLGLHEPAGSTAIAISNTTTVSVRPMLDALGDPMPQGGLPIASTLAEAERQKYLFDQVVRLGRLSAYERTANLLVELLERHRRAGLSDGARLPWPLTQETLANVLGLSNVHMNRTLQALRAADVIVLRGGQLIVPDLERLIQTAGRET